MVRQHMLDAAKLATLVAVCVIGFYLVGLWWPKPDAANWREGLRLKEWYVAVYVALAASLLVFVIFSTVNSVNR
jgi:hypothetical protein